MYARAVTRAKKEVRGAMRDAPWLTDKDSNLDSCGYEPPAFTIMLSVNVLRGISPPRAGVSPWARRYLVVAIVQLVGISEWFMRCFVFAQKFIVKKVVGFLGGANCFRIEAENSL